LKYADNIERSDCECCNYYYHQQQQHQRGRRHNIIISKPKLGGNYPWRSVRGAVRHGMRLRRPANDVDKPRHDKVVRKAPHSARWQVCLLATYRARYCRRGV